MFLLYSRSIMLTSSYIGGSSQRARILRRGVARQMCLMQVSVTTTVEGIGITHPSRAGRLDESRTLEPESQDKKESRYCLHLTVLTTFLGFAIPKIIWMSVIVSNRKDTVRFSSKLQLSLLFVISRCNTFTQVLIYRLICAPVHRRFPTVESLVEQGIIQIEFSSNNSATNLHPPTHVMHCIQSICMYLIYNDCSTCSLSQLKISQLRERATERCVFKSQVVTLKEFAKKRKDLSNIECCITGYLLQDELPDLADTKFWQPIKWAMEYVRIARQERLIGSDNAVQDIYQVITTYSVLR